MLKWFVVSEVSIQRPHWWASPEWCLAVIAALTCCVVGWQSWETRKAAKAGRDAAEASLKQADRLAASERAWATVSVVNFAEPIEGQRLVWIDLPIKNCGKTPAIVQKIVAMSHIVPAPQGIGGRPGKLPDTPDYNDPDKLIKLERRDIFVAPNDTHNGLQVFIRTEEYRLVKAKELTLYVYGFIEYRDTIDKELHATHFCSLYWIPERGYDEPTGFAFSAIIPAAYIRAT